MAQSRFKPSLSTEPTLLGWSRSGFFLRRSRSIDSGLGRSRSGSRSSRSGHTAATASAAATGRGATGRGATARTSGSSSAALRSRTAGRSRGRAAGRSWSGAAARLAAVVVVMLGLAALHLVRLAALVGRFSWRHRCEQEPQRTCNSQSKHASHRHVSWTPRRKKARARWTR